MKTLILVLLVSTVMATHAADNKSMLEKNREDYQQQLARIDADAETALKQWPAQHLQSLSTLEDKLQAAGDLDAVLAIRKEKDRFAAKKQVSKDAIVAAPQELHDLQMKALNSPDDVEVDRNKQILTLAAKYVKTLETLKQSLTQVGQIDQAIVVDTEIDSMKIHPEVVAARLALFMADVEANEEVEGKALPPGLKKGLILYYSFDKNEGGIVTDQSGQGHTGTACGATWATNGIAGGAYSLDGSDDYINLKPSGAFPSSVTLSMWVKFSRVDSYTFLFSSTDPSPGYGTTFAVRDIGGNDWRISWGTWSSPGNTYGGEAQIAKPDLHRWYHFSITQDGTTNAPSIYLNGISQTVIPTTLQGNPVHNSYPWNLGMYINLYRTSATFDETRIYDRVLSAREIKQLYSVR